MDDKIVTLNGLYYFKDKIIEYMNSLIDSKLEVVEDELDKINGENI